ncbi:MAG TPA: 2-C-methyl-D-erythritol 2,4-cyclodiphosphate synthase [Ignavibacteriaceae bacterium]|nr:2-C-methyl-D-erythritol 2,4-cyclodiphosphate synthase [Ignavibacteriaceae bacterium]
MNNFRIGQGFDVHKFSEDRDLFIGGVKIPFEKGLLGHSDADVLLHAICDAMLGALALGDIGIHFPDTDQSYKNIDSKILLDNVYTLIKSKGYEIGNIDSTLLLQRPKISSFIPKMIEVISNLLSIDKEQVSIKATTTEKLGFVGREEGVAAMATVLLFKHGE